MTSLEAASLPVPSDAASTSLSTSSSSSSSSLTAPESVVIASETTEKLTNVEQTKEETNIKQSGDDVKKMQSTSATVTTAPPTSTNNPITEFVQETLGRKNSPTLTATRIPQLQQSTITATDTAITTSTATSIPSAIAIATATATTSPHTKLQHDHQRYPLTALLHTTNNAPTHPFQRSASLRLRGSKLNILFDTVTSSSEKGEGGDCADGGVGNGNGVSFTATNDCNMDMEHAHNNKINGINARVTKQTVALGVTRTKERDQPERGSHERHKAGQLASTTTASLATRRKFMPSGTSTYSPAISLTRSLSSRRSYPNNLAYKTDANEDNRANVEAAAAATAGVAVADTEIATVDKLGIGAANSVIGHNATPLNSCAHLEQLQAAGNCVNTLTNGDACDGAAEHDIMDDVTNRKNVRDTQKMSLNLSGGATTTSKATSPAAATTGSGINVSNKSTATTPKTPSYTQSHHYHHLHQHYIGTTKYVKSSPTATHETKLTPKTPPVTPDSPCTYLDDDLDSMYSFATTTSGRSTMSCEHPYVARNGTTFSGRKMKYVVHCSNYAGQVGPDYLTPTQRAARQIRRLKELLCLARQDLEQKDSEILRLTREVVELRLFKASLSSPEERSASSDAVTVREAELKTSQDVSPIVDMVDDATKSSPRHLVSLHQQHLQHQHLQHSQQLSSEMQSSFADSGHFEDMTTSSVHSKDSYAAHTQDIACGSDEAIGGVDGVLHEESDGIADAADAAAAELAKIKSYELQRQELIRMYEAKIEELIRTQDTASSEMKRSHNDKVEALLQKLAECNTRYADIVPDYEHAKERIRELEKQLEDLQRKLTEQEEKQNKMYLHMYQKGQEAERIARADQALELAHRAPDNKVSINELLHQLQNTQDELENIRAAECRNECGSNHALLTAKEAISLWVLGARKTIYRRLLEAQKNRTHVDPEVTLQFLKSAIYYFLTDKENSQGHLQAIESILEFTETERQNINKARVTK